MADGILGTYRVGIVDHDQVDTHEHLEPGDKSQHLLILLLDGDVEVQLTCCC